MTVHELRKQGFTVKVRHTRIYSETQKLDGISYDVLPKGGLTDVAIYKDNAFLANGMAKCSDHDNYCKKLGTKIALGRAVKELSVLSKEFFQEMV